MSPKGYWIAVVDISDETRFADYVAALGPALAPFGAKTIVRNGRKHIPEDPFEGHHVVVEFETYAAAVECYNSPAYQDVLQLRKASARTRFVIIEGS